MIAKAPKQKLLDAAGYIRMSTDRQEQSPARQRSEIKRLAEREGYRIAEWYEDLGKSGTESSKRTGFQKLLADAKQKKFEAVLVYEISRVSREDLFAALSHFGALHDAGICVVSCMQGRLDFNNIGGIITGVVGIHSARTESVTLANRVVSGRRAALAKGHHINGYAPVGYDREIRDDKGEVVRQVHISEKFTKPLNWTSRLVVSSDQNSVDLVRFMFSEFDKGTSLQQIAREANRRAIKGRAKNAFDASVVRRILENPVYIGSLRLGYHKRGKLATLCEHDGPLVIEKAHPAIVDKALFARVQKRLARQGHSREKSPAGRYLLSGLITCGHCGAVIYGKFGRNGSQESRLFYDCVPRLRNTNPCEHPLCSADVLDAQVLEAIVSRLLTEANSLAMVKADQQTIAETDSADEARLAELQRKIDKATENLALAEDRDQFQMMATKIRGWKAQAEAIRLAAVDRLATAENREFARVTLTSIARLKGRIQEADRALQAAAVKATIDRVVLSVGWAGQREELRHTVAEVHIRKDIADIPPLRLIVRGKRKRTYWVETMFALRDGVAGRPIVMAPYLGICAPAISQLFNQLIAGGFVTRKGQQNYLSDAGREFLAGFSNS